MGGCRKADPRCGFLLMVQRGAVAGSFMDASAIVLILAPIFFPIAMKLELDPIPPGLSSWW